MAQISVTINGRSFRMACDDGEEDRLVGLAQKFDGMIDELRASFGEIGDQRLTVMAGIMATDQLVELEKKTARLEAELDTTREEKRAALEAVGKQEATIAGAINDMAIQVEALASGLTSSLKTS